MGGMHLGTGPPLSKPSTDDGPALGVVDAVCTNPANVNRLLLEEPSAAAWWVRCAIAEGDRWSAASVVASAQVLGETNLAYPALGAAGPRPRRVLARPRSARRSYRRIPPALGRGVAAEDAGVTSTDPNAVARKLAHALTVYERVGGWSATRGAEGTRLPADVAPTAAESCTPNIGLGKPHGDRTSDFCARGAGLTNARTAEQMYLSRHTVDFHLRQIYRKLAINSRVELTRLVVLHDANETIRPLGVPSPAAGPALDEVRAT